MVQLLIEVAPIRFPSLPVYGLSLGHPNIVVAFGQYEPKEHAAQLLDPSTTEIYPGKQLLHDACPVRFPNFPTGHLAHFVLLLFVVLTDG